MPTLQENITNQLATLTTFDLADAQNLFIKNVKLYGLREQIISMLNIKDIDRLRFSCENLGKQSRNSQDTFRNLSKFIEHYHTNLFPDVFITDYNRRIESAERKIILSKIFKTGRDSTSMYTKQLITVVYSLKMLEENKNLLSEIQYYNRPCSLETLKNLREYCYGIYLLLITSTHEYDCLTAEPGTRILNHNNFKPYFPDLFPQN